jgi:hypothetical protein
MVDDDARQVVFGDLESQPSVITAQTMATTLAEVRSRLIRHQRETSSERERAPGMKDARLRSLALRTIHSNLRIYSIWNTTRRLPVAARA